MSENKDYLTEEQTELCKQIITNFMKDFIKTNNLLLEQYIKRYQELINKYTDLNKFLYPKNIQKMILISGC